MSHTLTENFTPTDGIALQTAVDTGYSPAPKRHYLEVTHMRIKSHAQQIRLVHILLVIVLMTGIITSKPNVTFSRATSAHPAAISCPPPTIEQNQICVLEPPVTNPSQTKFEVKKTIELTSDMTLDCKNLTLVPDQSAPNQGVGKGIDPNWPTGRSTPEVAIFLRGARNVTIKNCVIQDFDFGIYAINSKLPSGPLLDPKNPQPKIDRQNRIQGNSITARFVPITLMHQDNTLVQNNFVTYKTVGGKGIVVERDSDLNQIVRNIITTNFVEIDALMAPGPSTISTNLIQKTGTGIVVGQMSPNESTLLNVVVNNQLYQVSTTSNPDPQPPPNPVTYSGLRELSELNLVEGNSITGPSNYPFPGIQNAMDGIALPVAIGTTISNNTISNVTFGMRVGVQPAEDTKGVNKRLFPNKCQVKTTRLCLSDLDCNVPNLDPPPVDKCMLTPGDSKFVSWLSIGTTVDENKIYGPFVSAITFAGKDTIVSGNTIVGPQTPINGAVNNAIPGALLLAGRHALESATVTENSVSNVYIALSLQSTFTGLKKAECVLSQRCPHWTSCLGAKIYLNDFSNYTIAVQTNNDYDLLPSSSLLSFDDKGNYWGDHCSDRKNVYKRNGDGAPVFDCHPFTKPVAHAMPNALPPICAP